MNNKKLLAATIGILALGTFFLLWDTPMKYYLDYGDGRIKDATKYVESGEYYFNCEIGRLIRKSPLRFPYEVLASEGTITVATGAVDEHLDPLLITYIEQAGWAKELLYTNTWLSEGGYIIGHEFYQRTVVEGKDVIVRVLYKERAEKSKKFSVRIQPYETDTPYTQVQWIEKAKNSCSEPQ